MKLDNIKNRWTPTPREDFHEKEYVRCDGPRVVLSPCPVTSDPWSSIFWSSAGTLWFPEVGIRVATEARKRDAHSQGRYFDKPLVWDDKYATSSIDAPGGPWMWLGFLDAHVPLQPVDAVVVREFFRQTVEELQQLRREGWTFLRIGPTERPSVWEVLAERVEKDVPS